ncbi:DNA-binding MarR family transcriptional regulator [Streptosporangium becharense]|uniref:DNA-binding MarR family transcriptional regulator n=1 Tax=Streptosporangium becharense TaxID=1816182 RepID=A0A7W9IGI1_9ACTN|nr:DNA-binding MarR family transcriptional regulator [Streptosporangium becharense]MBB5820263.1 DNA-binding MarR family transcriptional regulator [Streptosporangium becharense]
MIPFDDSRLTAMGLLAEAYTGIAVKTHRSFATAGLSEIDFETLIRLARSPGGRLRMSDLAAQTSLSTSGMTRVVDRLEREGLVARQSCSTDRRASYAAITPAGTDRLSGVIPQHLADIETWFTGLLTPEQLSAFLDALRTIRDAVRPCATAGAESALPDTGRRCDDTGAETTRSG